MLDKNELKKFFGAIGVQRAGLMAMINVIMERDDDEPLYKSKTAIAKLFEQMIDEDAMVGDAIDMEVIRTMRDFCLRRGAEEDILDKAKDILNNKPDNNG